MKKKKSKGFTMVELLAVITILGILTIIAVPSTKLLIKKGQDNYYKTQKNQIELAAKEYVKNNKKLLPTNIGDTKEIKLQELIDNKYISRVKDHNKVDCNAQETKVIITRIGKKKYKYDVYLDCSNYREKPTDNNTGNITFSIVPIYSNNQTVSSTTNFKVQIKITGNKNIKYYKYRILSGSAVLEEKEFELLANPVIKELDLTEYVKRSKLTSVTIEVNAVTVDNYKKSTSKTLSVEDNVSPKCPDSYNNATTQIDNKTLYLKDENGNILVKTRSAWSKDPQTITVYCYDKDNAGSTTQCKNNQYTKTYKTDKELSSEFSMEDMMGNKISCKIPKSMIRIDNTNPTCTTSYTAPSGYPNQGTPNNNGWTNKPVTLKGTCSDGEGSGCEGNIERTYASNVNDNLTPGVVRDNVGNTGTCPQLPVKLDVVKPTTTCTLNPVKDNKGNKTRYVDVTVTGNDDFSGTMEVAFFTKNEKDEAISPCSSWDVNNTNCYFKNTTTKTKRFDTGGWNKTIKIACASNDHTGQNHIVTQTYKSDPEPPKLPPGVTPYTCKYRTSSEHSYSSFSKCGNSNYITGSGNRYTKGYAMYYYDQDGNLYNCVGRRGDVVFWHKSVISGTVDIGEPGKKWNNSIHTCGKTSCYPSDAC